MSGVTPSNKINTLAIVSFVSAFFISVAGIVMGHLALRQIKTSGEQGRGLAIAGLIVGYVFAALTLVGIAIVAYTLFALSGVSSSSSGGPLAAPTRSLDAYDLLDQPDPPRKAAPAAPPAEEKTAAAPYGEAPAPDSSEYRDWTGTINLNNEPMSVTLYGAQAPQGVAAFASLANTGFYNGTSCHRLSTGGFDLLQCGDPSSTGTGGPDYRFGPVENAPTNDVYQSGDIVLARVANEPNSMGSQFFIMYSDTSISSDSAGGYTVIGRVTSGIETVEKIAAGGVRGGGHDGAPALPAEIASIAVK